MRSHDEEREGDSPWHRGVDPGNQEYEVISERVPYQAVLRALGSWLDDRRAKRVNVLEAMGGFAVRYQLDSANADTESFFLAYNRLLSLADELENRRKRRAFPRLGREAPQATYENLLRALGYELDGIDAYSILIDEVDEGMLVTYQYLRPTEGFQARKRMVILGPEAVQSVLEDARARREYWKSGVFALLAG